METKSWLASKTIWTNLILGAVTVATALGVDVGLDATAQAELVAGIVVVANLILRFVTKQPVS